MKRSVEIDIYSIYALAKIILLKSRNELVLRKAMSKVKIDPANRLDNVSPSAMRKLFEIANEMRAQGKTVIDFGLGDIDIPLPYEVHEGIKQSLLDGKTKYGLNQGEVALRERISEKYQNQHDLDIPISQIVVTCGSLESLLDTSLSYINPGDDVLFIEPEFAYFGWQVKIAGGNIVPVTTSKETGFTPNLDQLQEKISSKTKALLLNYPNNPTAGVLEDDHFKAIVEICEDSGILLISDEAYERITFDGFKHKSAIDYDYENIIVVNTTSKSLCMTGLRVGYTISRNPDLMKPIIQLHQYNTAHAAVPMQYGALAGFEHEDAILNRIVSQLQSRRDVLVDSWKGIPGMEFEKPKGTFYLYPDISGTGMSASEFTEFALKQGVVLTPGDTFCFNKGASAGTNHVRIAYGVTSEEEIRQAGQILKEALAD